jgi:hypothetical protein
MLSFVLSYLLMIAGILVFETVAAKLFKQKQFTSIILSISFLGALVSLVVSFDAYYAKLIIIIFYIVAVFMAVYKVFAGGFSLKKYFHDRGLFLIISAVLLCIVTCYRFYSINFTYVFNGHDPYFFGIPFEILKADYHSRLKVFDNFPETWSSYHFFNGATSAVVLLPTICKDVFIYKASKLVLFVICIFSLNEQLQLSKQKKILAFLLAATAFSYSLSWYIYTNGSLTLYFFLMFLITVRSEEKLSLSLLALLLFTTSVSRSILPGFALLAFVMYAKKKEISFLFRSKPILYLLLTSIPLLNVASMFAGPPRDVSTPFIQRAVSNFYDYGWGSLFSIRFLGAKAWDFARAVYTRHFSLEYILAAIGLLVLLGCCWTVRKDIIKILLKMKIFVAVTLLAGAILLVTAFAMRAPTILTAGCHILMYVFFYYFIQFFIDKSYRNFALVFLFTSALQVYLVSPAAGIPNFVLLDWIVFLGLIESQRITPYIKKLGTGLVIAVLLMACFFDLQYALIARPPSYDSTSHQINMADPQFKDSAFLNALVFEYSSPADSLKASIATSIYGKRVKYYKESPSSFSMSKAFIGHEVNIKNQPKQ